MEVPPRAKQVFYSLAPLLNMMLMGMSFGYPALMMPALVRGDGLRADIDDAAWISATPGVSGMFFGVIIGPLMHYYGRRLPHIGTNLLILAGWILTSQTTAIWVLALGTGLQGLGTGLMTFYSITIGEFTCPELRGVLLLSKLLFVSVGVFIIHGLGYFMHWKKTALIPVVPVCMAICISYFSPDTPDWLVSRNRFDEAEKVFYKLRGQGKESDRQIRELIDARKIKSDAINEKPAYWRVLKKLKSKALWRPLLLLFCCILLPEAGGRHFFPSYSLQLAEQISGAKSDGFFYTMSLDLISIVCAAASCALIKRYNRRFMLITSGYAASVFYLISSLLLYFKSKSDNSKSLMYASIVFLAIYTIIVYTTVFGSCYVTLGELLPLEYRSIGLALNGCIAGVSSSVFLKLLPIFQRWFDVHGMLAAFCGIMLLCLFYIDYDYPETKDRTLHDIGEYFSGKSPKIRMNNEVFCDEETAGLNLVQR